MYKRWMELIRHFHIYYPESVRVAGFLLFVSIALPVHVWVLPVWMPPGYDVQSMRTAMVCLLILGIAYGFVFSRRPGQSVDMRYFVHMMSVQVVAALITYSALRLFDEANDENLIGFVLANSWFAVALGTLLRVCEPPRDYWRSMHRVLRGQY
jgi:hypothetical protein